MKQLIKSLVFGRSPKPRRIPFGLYRGLTLNIDPNGELAYFFGTYELETHSWLRSAIAMARSFIDIGAGNGELVAWALKHPQIEQALAYDAAPSRWGLFQKNIALNGFATDHRLYAVCGEFLSADSRSEDLQRVLGLPEPVLLKMDIDGGEQHVLQSLGPVLEQKKILMLIETHSRELDAACLAHLRAAGYTANQLTPSWIRRWLPENRPLEFNQWITASNVNDGR